MTPGRPPPLRVLQAFGLQGKACPLPGGQGTTWRVDDVVLKPGSDAKIQAWLGEELATIDQVGFVLPEVVRGQDGRWVVEGWGATRLLLGSSSETHDVEWLTVLEAGRAFHRAAHHLPRPDWLAERSNWWTRADAAAWGEQSMDVIAQLEPLVARLSDVDAPPGRDQLVHADLTGNVLIGGDHPPGIIDVSPYWRPSAYAEGVVIADAICWHGAEPGLLLDADVSLPAVARGMLFRVLTTNVMHQDRADPSALARDLARYTDAARCLGL